jgi:hypothetical protein
MEMVTGAMAAARVAVLLALLGFHFQAWRTHTRLAISARNACTWPAWTTLRHAVGVVADESDLTQASVQLVVSPVLYAIALRPEDPGQLRAAVSRQPSEDYASYPTLRPTLEALDRLQTRLYPNAVIPVALAH